MVVLVDIAAGDVINIALCILMGHERLLINTNVVIHVRIPAKNIIQKISTLPSTSNERTYKVNDVDCKILFLHFPDSNNRLLYMFILLLTFAKCFISANKCIIRKAKT